MKMSEIPIGNICYSPVGNISYIRISTEQAYNLDHCHIGNIHNMGFTDYIDLGKPILNVKAQTSYQANISFKKF